MELARAELLLGVGVVEDALVVHPLAPGEARPAEIDTYGDHRMAMAFAVAGLRLPGLALNDPACVRKTYPGFFADWARLGGVGGARG